MKIIYTLKIFFILSIINSCKTEKCTPDTYLKKSLNIIEKKYLHKNSINWEIEKQIAIKKSKDINSIEEVTEILYAIFDKAKDNHSYIMDKKFVKDSYSNKQKYESIKFKLIKNKIGYISIPHFVGNDNLQLKFAQEIQKRIKELDKHNLKYWIIDLTNNQGGNMFPMCLGLAPILDNDILGYFLKNGKYEKWILKNNAIYENKKKLLELKQTYSLKNKKKKISILIGNKTASSGEMTAIMFKGFKNVKFYGEDTAGLLTANSIFDMCDGSKLILSTSVAADRNKVIYQGKLSPDIYTKTPLKTAIEFLLDENITEQGNITEKANQ